MKDKIYVIFDYEDIYSREQFFKEEGSGIYYGRDHFQLWHTVHNENGTLVLELVVPCNIKFVVCDEQNHKLFISSNNRKEEKFPLLRYQSLLEWHKIRDRYPVISENGFAAALFGITKSKLGTYLLSGYQEDNCKTSGHGMSTDEWMIAYQMQIGESEILHTFYYCGKEMHIYRICKQHSICKKNWYEYYSGMELVGLEFTLFTGKGKHIK